MLMVNVLPLTLLPAGGTPREIEVGVKRVGCSRNASRDVEATRTSVEETRARGFQMHPPAGVCFRSRYLLTNEDAIEVQGPQTSGEAEFVALRHGGEIYVSVGSDHNDRSLEELWTEMLGKVFDTAKSKQMVPAVVAREAWPYVEVRDHWDQLIVRSYVTVAGERIPYQDYTLSELLDLEYYLDRCEWMREDGSVLLGGSGSQVPTVPESVFQGQTSMEGVTFPPDFQFEMVDPVLDRTIAHAYDILPLEEPGSLSL